MADDAFEFPDFFSYPPYFTLQPVKETRDRQAGLWGSLILAYCKHQKHFVIHLDQDHPLFHNASINRKLDSEAKKAFLSELVASKQAEWLDREKRSCLVLWKKIEEWARVIQDFSNTYGLKDSVYTVDELSKGMEVRKTELEGVHQEVLTRALKLLESQGKVRCVIAITLMLVADAAVSTGRQNACVGVPRLLQRHRTAHPRQQPWDVLSMAGSAN